VNNDGEGVGKMSLATKITADKDRTTVTLENYDTQPVLLQSVKRQRASD
jgi:P pilus assembly chaperone PapD